MAFDEDPTHLIPERTEANSDDTKRIKKKTIALQTKYFASNKLET